LVRDTAKKNESFNGKRFWENHPDYWTELNKIDSPSKIRFKAGI
jgi:hypothetical protein